MKRLESNSYHLHDVKMPYNTPHQVALRQRSPGVEADSAFQKLLFTYMMLWIFEGALRKWVFPEAQAVIYLARVPLTIILVALALRVPSRQSALPLQVGIFVTFGLLVLSAWHVITENQPVSQMLFGLRSYCEAMLIILASRRAMTAGTAKSMSRGIALLTPAMALLATLQVLSPATSPVNRIFGDEGDGIFYTAGGVVRPSGTFTSSLGHTLFSILALACVLGLWRSRPQPRTLTYTIYLASVMVLIATSGSRTALAFGAIVAIAYIVASTKAGLKTFLLRSFGLAATLGIASVALNLLLPSVIDAFTERIFVASRQEDTGARLIGSGIGFWDYLQVSQPLGSGLGSRTQGQSALPIEDELNRWSIELGYLPFGLLIILRIVFCTTLVCIAWRKTSSDYLAPFVLAAAFACEAFVGQATSQASVIGFVAIAGALAIAPSPPQHDLQGHPLRTDAEIATTPPRRAAH